MKTMGPVDDDRPYIDLSLRLDVAAATPGTMHVSELRGLAGPHRAFYRHDAGPSLSAIFAVYPVATATASTAPKRR